VRDMCGFRGDSSHICLCRLGREKFLVTVENKASKIISLIPIDLSKRLKNVKDNKKINNQDK